MCDIDSPIALPCVPEAWKILMRPGCSRIINVVCCLHVPLLVHGDRFSSCFPWWAMVKASTGALSAVKSAVNLRQGSTMFGASSHCKNADRNSVGDQGVFLAWSNFTFCKH